MGFFKYVKSAFLNRWNLLALGGALGFAVLSGPFWSVLVPLILAGEIAYLALLSANPKFQQYVNAQEALAARQQTQAGAAQMVQRLLDALPDKLVQRFEALRARCAELRQLALELRDPHRVGEPPPREELQLAGLDRLLWIYLRLLFTQHSLERFLVTTSAEQIRRDIKSLQGRLSELPADEGDPQRQKVRKALEDNLETSRARLANYEKARDNCELVKLEIERLENKIRSLSELAVNRHEPDFIAGQVDQVVSGMVQTERTMNELQFVTGLQAADEAVPELLRRETVQTRH